MTTLLHRIILYVSGILFLIFYISKDYLLQTLWIFGVFPLLISGVVFLVSLLFIVGIKNKKGLLFGVIVLSIVLTYELLNSELFKSKKILEAVLIDDLSSITLTLRENNTFEINSSNFMSDDTTFIGSYRIIGNKIIFNDKRYYNDFIPDTVSIIGNNIILKFDKEGKPVTEFATYFEIRKNEISR